MKYIITMEFDADFPVLRAVADVLDKKGYSTQINDGGSGGNSWQYDSGNKELDDKTIKELGKIRGVAKIIQF